MFVVAASKRWLASIQRTRLVVLRINVLSLPPVVQTLAYDLGFPNEQEPITTCRCSIDKQEEFDGREWRALWIKIDCRASGIRRPRKTSRQCLYEWRNSGSSHLDAAVKDSCCTRCQCNFIRVLLENFFTASWVDRSLQWELQCDRSDLSNHACALSSQNTPGF